MRKCGLFSTDFYYWLVKCTLTALNLFFCSWNKIVQTTQTKRINERWFVPQITFVVVIVNEKALISPRDVTVWLIIVCVFKWALHFSRTKTIQNLCWEAFISKLWSPWSPQVLRSNLTYSTIGLSWCKWRRQIDMSNKVYKVHCLAFTYVHSLIIQSRIFWGIVNRFIYTILKDEFLSDQNLSKNENFSPNEHFSTAKTSRL